MAQNPDLQPSYSDIEMIPVTSQHQANTSPPSADQLYMPQMFQHLPEYHQNIFAFLSTVDVLRVKMKSGCCVGGASDGKYVLKNGDGVKLMEAFESGERCCSLNVMCKMSTGPIDMQIFDVHENEIIRLIMPNAYDCCFYFCKPRKLEVYSVGKHLIATIEQKSYWSTGKFIIRNAHGQKVLKINLSYQCCNVEKLKVLSMAENVKVGSIVNYQRKHAFKITYAFNLDVTLKAAMIGAAFFIHFLVFNTRTPIGLIAMAN